MSSRIVSVFGATGLQGSSVIRLILQDGTFTPRAITRDPESAAAQKLTAQGVEVVKADSQDKASLVHALRGSEAVFAVTVPAFNARGGEAVSEQTQGKNMVDAAKEAGVKFFIWAGMPSISKISNGKYTKCLHYDEKAAVEEYLKSSGVPHASIYLGGFLENYWKFGNLKKTGTGFDVAIPLFKAGDLQAFTWVEHDVPAAALALLKNYTDPSKNVLGKSYPVVTACIPYSELAEKTAKALGVEVTFTSAPPIGIAEMDEMFAAHIEYKGLYIATPVPNPDLVALGVKFGTIEEFMETEVKPRFGQK